MPVNCDVDWSDPNSGLVKVELFIENHLKQNRKHKYN